MSWKNGRQLSLSRVALAIHLDRERAHNTFQLEQCITKYGST